MEYKNLDINSRINLKATLLAFKRYAVEDWQRDLEKKLYRSNRTAAGNSLRYARTRLLRTDWDSSIIRTVAGISTLRFAFPLYGRFVDMGVGKGTNYEERRTWRTKRIGFNEVLYDRSSKRQHVRWYSKRKSFSQRRLSEVLVKRYGLGMVSFVENQLTFEVSLTL